MKSLSFHRASGVVVTLDLTRNSRPAAPAPAKPAPRNTPRAVMFGRWTDLTINPGTAK